MSTAIIIVTHNSARFLPRTMCHLQEQTLPPHQIILVDSASEDPSYLFPYQQENVTLLLSKRNIGFCQGNNLGMALVDKECQYVLFLNPDAFLHETFLKGAFEFMEANKTCGAVTGTLLGYDIEADKPTGKYDSTGVFQKWYGRWYDRFQGRPCETIFLSTPEPIPALCGALMFCRKTALEQVLLNKKEVFNQHYFMYKEDIDLSSRLRAAGWQLMLCPQLHAYHCRGWKPKRSLVPRKHRLLAARNELHLHKRIGSPIHIAYSFLKYTGVRWLDL